ncbi:MAG: NADH:ubiquinone reductase (Na(+)-transporting) subunit D [Rhabdochlamydiaceae bacterium]|nr:NADH:ubiquinone reductase (Na(+)-transporting) subunit D [Candidatus Amphrikana amoebophyrae]
MKKSESLKAFIAPLWHDNQILVAVLGICSALAVTIKVSIALVMGFSVMFVTAFSCLFVSLLRKKTPDSVRMITQLAIISLFVIIVDQVLKAFSYEMSKTLSVFVGLIITNCIVMGRCESNAKNVSPMPAFFDGLGAATGYAIVLLIVGTIREILAFGTFLDMSVIPQSWYATAEHPDLYANWNIMALAPSAFFIIGGMIWLYNIARNQEGV